MKLSPLLTPIVPILSLLFTSSATAGSQPAPQAPTAGTGPAGAFVLISGTDADGTVRSAAGFVVDASGTIATTLHGLRGLVKASVRLANGDSYDLTHVRAFDDGKDLAIVQIRAFGVPASELGNSDALAAGDAVTMWTIPLGGESHAAPTSIADIQRAEGSRILQTTTPLDAANCGTPLLDSSGRAVGIVALTHTGRDRHAVAVPINYVRGLLASDEKLTLRDLVVRVSADGGTTPPTDTGSDASSEPAFVVFYRLRRFTGFALEPPVYCDNKELADMDNGRYFKVQLAPGSHVCRSNDQSAVQLDLKPGETHYVRIEIVTGALKGHGAVSEVPKGQGEIEITRLKPLDVSNVKDPSVLVK
jgi:hypothetical protein